jgi:putative glutamine amidotransferase
MGREDTLRPRIGITASRSGEMQRYVDYVESAGGEALVLRPGDRIDLEKLDGLLLSGGVDVHPRHYDRQVEAALSLDEERDAFEVPLGRAALTTDLPVFGICRGFQLLNVLAGGALVQHFDGHRTAEGSDAPSGHHAVKIAPSSRLADVLGAGEVEVNSRHHQGLTEAELAPALRATAWSPDGYVEGLELADRSDRRWLLAVQWHPERVAECAPACRELARAFVAAATEHARTRKQPALSA